jgi:CrcB protein
MSPLAWIGVGVFGAAGAYARFAVAAAVTARRPGDFPWGTFVVNLTGGFALGVLTGAGITGAALFVLGTGFMGGYTTFSTWMVETQRLGEDAELGLAGASLLGSMLAGLAATGAGWALAGALS